MKNVIVLPLPTSFPESLICRRVAAILDCTKCILGLSRRVPMVTAKHHVNVAAEEWIQSIWVIAVLKQSLYRNESVKNALKKRTLPFTGAIIVSSHKKRN